MQRASSISTMSEYLTAKELASHWKVSERMIRDLEKKGVLKPKRFGRAVRYALKDILVVEARGGF
jgi:DNA-binding transcriptional MerR regulator